MNNITLFLLINMFSGMGYSLVSPLFPSLGKKDNISEEVLGWIISAYSIAGTIITPFVPRIIKKIPRIYLLCISTFLEASCTFLYGFLIYIDSYKILISIIFFLRIIHGFSSAIVATLLYSLTISLADENELQISLGNLEVGWSLGTSSGPLFASFCYRFGGYSLPFIALGLILFISTYLAWHVKSEKLNSEEEQDENPKFASFLLHPLISLIVLGFVMIMIVSSFYYPCLTNHLGDNYNLSVSISSLFFVIPIISYIIILQFLDKITSNLGIYTTFYLGLLTASFAPLFIYPCTPIPKSLISIIFGFLLIGIGTAQVFIPGLLALSKNIRIVDKNIDELTANDISSALNNLTLDAGEFVGPILGGFLTSRYNFGFCCFVVFVITAGYSGIFFLYFFPNIKEDVKFMFMKKTITEMERNLGKNIMDIHDNEDNFDDQMSCNSLVLNHKSFFGSFKIDSISRRRNSYSNLIRKKQRNSKASLFSALTN